MVFYRTVVHDGELKPVVGNFDQRAGNGCIAGFLNCLAVGEELIPGVVRAGHCNAAVCENSLVHKHILPVSGRGNGILLAVSGNCHHASLHVACVIGILRTDLIDGDNFAGRDERFRIGIGKIEQDVRLGASLEVRQDFGFPLFV